MKSELTNDELNSLLTSTVPTAAVIGLDSHHHSGQFQVRNALAQLHAEFTATLAEDLSRLAGREVIARMTSTERSSYGQFVFGQPVPTCCVSVNTRPINTDLYLAIRPTILFPLLDRVMGSHQMEAPQQRPLTELETEVARCIVNQVLLGYRAAWQPVLALDLHVDRVEHNAQRMRTLPGIESVFLVQYDVRCGRDQGLLELCLPWESTHQMRERLAANCKQS